MQARGDRGWGDAGVLEPTVEGVAGEGERLERESELVRAGLRLVDYAVAEVSRRLPRYVNRDDLVSAGMFGLSQAARTFDPSRGVSFTSYASARVRGAVVDELRSVDWASRSARARFRDLERVADDLTSASGRQPTRVELARCLGVDIKGLNRLLGDIYLATVLNYDSIVESGDFESVFSSGDACPEREILDRERCAYLRDAVAVLPERLRYVVVGYFFEDRTMQSLATDLGVTESRISQMRAQALGLLRDALSAHLDSEVRAGEPGPAGRAARRKEAYYASVAALSDFRSRVSAEQPTVHELMAKHSSSPLRTNVRPPRRRVKADVLGRCA